MQFKYFIGIDVSKAHLDWSIVYQKEEILKKRIRNCVEQIEEFVQELSDRFGSTLSQALFCLEYTGKYNYYLVQVLENREATLWQVSPLHMKLSLGIQRGKSDPVDAHRIALFAMRHEDERREHYPIRSALQQVKTLFSLRRIMVTSAKSLKNQLADLEFIESGIQDQIALQIKESLAQMKTRINTLEELMLQRIHDDTRLSRLFIIITSVIGIGSIIAIKILITTNEFKKIRSPKKLACHTGIAPFGESSGTSINKPDRVSNMADHELKRLLHMAALVAIRTPGEMKQYYERKKAQGKHSMSVINAVRNKIVHRIYACVKADRLYRKQYEHLVETA